MEEGGRPGGNGGGQEKGVTELVGSDMTKKMEVQGCCVGDDGDSAVGKRGGSSTMAVYL